MINLIHCVILTFNLHLIDEYSVTVTNLRESTLAIIWIFQNIGAGSGTILGNAWKMLGNDTRRSETARGRYSFIKTFRMRAKTWQCKAAPQQASRERL